MVNEDSERDRKNREIYHGEYNHDNDYDKADDYITVGDDDVYHSERADVFDGFHGSPVLVATMLGLLLNLADGIVHLE
ncbi:hypothetical protein DPMN_096927 [Dreissena polymorpha]|uniref:Uncharacterized protein n=1 Tax=Dreissena polymorpha TaxID=45954 RepID=A0A9D4R438_DREPO|nr:hypothetical protein DPMN_096927 [Dreissena polymorpha]